MVMPSYPSPRNDTMKMNGKKIAGPNQEIVALPRGNGDDIIFIARSVPNYDEFHAKCPIPVPPSRIEAKTGTKIYDTDDPGYRAGMKNYSERKQAWMVIKSLEATPGIEWEKVKLDEPKTWVLWHDELKEDGLNEIELQRVHVGVLTANCLNEGAVEDARNAFLRGLEEAAKRSSGQNTEPAST